MDILYLDKSNTKDNVDAPICNLLTTIACHVAILRMGVPLKANTVTLCMCGLYVRSYNQGKWDRTAIGAGYSTAVGHT